MKDLFKIYNYKVALPYVFFIIGIICYVLGLGEFIDVNVFLIPKRIHEILIGLGNLFVVGTIIGFMTSYAQHKKLYRDSLEEIIYNDKFLSKRNDINEIWTTTSKALFNSKFPEITDSLLTIINTNYFPIDKNSYYDHLIISINIAWKDNTKEKLIYQNTHSFDLISDGEKKISLPMSSWVDKSSENKIVECISKDISIPTETDIDEIKLIKYELDLEGDKKYSIKYTKEKTWKFEDDTDLCYRAKYIVNGLTVLLNYPSEDFNVKLICRGTIDDFIDIDSSNGVLHKRYDGLILPRQGYVITMTKK